jgi:hypothetical protein
MSLKHAANHLAAHGRGPDTELIHMTKGEINSLQQLAMAGGGSLTINPHTGLPEAGFLSKMLPMVAGAAAMYFTGGAAAPLIGGLSNAATIGLGMGALETARTGSLQKGLMAGMGAYGGAGLAGGLMGAGASAMNTTAANATQAANPQLMASEVGREMGQAGFVQPEIAANMNPATATAADKIGLGASNLGTAAGRNTFMTQMGGGSGLLKTGLAAAAPMIGSMLQPKTEQPQVATGDATMPQRLQYNSGATTTPFPQPDVPEYGQLGQDFGKQRNYFPSAGYQNITDEKAKELRGYAVGGLMPTQGGGPVEAMSNANAIGANTGFPMADINKGAYATPWQTPVAQNVVQGVADSGVNSMTGEQNEFARGGLSSAASHLGDYSDGGRLLKGPGDGVSDSIPAVIGNKRPARLADGEFVVPARIVSELGNGSTEAGARKLYAMLDRVQAARKKSIGKGKVAKNSRADKLLPA